MAKSQLLQKFREEIRRRNYSYRTEKTYIRWIIKYIKFNGVAHPRTLGEKHVVDFLNWLANKRNVAASTQNQALCAIVFLYKHVLDLPLGALDNLERAKEPKRLPVVLSKKEVHKILANMQGDSRLMAELLYGSGLRQSECLRLRVKDIDFEYNQVWVRSGKGKKDRATVLPDASKEKLTKQVKKIKVLHQRDLAKGHGKVILPKALSRKYPSMANRLDGNICFHPPSDQKIRARV